MHIAWPLWTCNLNHSVYVIGPVDLTRSGGKTDIQGISSARSLMGLAEHPSVTVTLCPLPQRAVIDSPCAQSLWVCHTPQGWVLLSPAQLA